MSQVRFIRVSEVCVCCVRFVPLVSAMGAVFATSTRRRQVAKTLEMETKPYNNIVNGVCAGRSVYVCMFGLCSGDVCLAYGRLRLYIVVRSQYSYAQNASVVKVIRCGGVEMLDGCVFHISLSRAKPVCWAKTGVRPAPRAKCFN